MRKTELLIPAGSLDVLKTAVVYGADAVYIGGEAFGLRAKAHNFSNEEMKQGIAFAHARGVKVYVTANILAHNGDLPGVEAYFEEMRDVAPDALIISDPEADFTSRSRNSSPASTLAPNTSLTSLTVIPLSLLTIITCQLYTFPYIIAYHPFCVFSI